MVPSLVSGVPDLHRFIVARGGDATAVGAERNAVTESVCPLSVSVSWPVTASQTLTVLSSLAEAMRRPSGLNATPVDGAGVSLERERLLAGRGIPDLDRLIVAGRGDATAVGAERHPIDAVGVSLERERLLAGRGIPDLDRLIVLAEAMRRPSGLNATP